MTAPLTSGIAQRLRQAADTIEAPQVIFAFSHYGQRTIVTAGTDTATVDPGPVELHYEIGSASKTFLGLLLADLVHDGVLDYDTRAHTCLPPAAGTNTSRKVTLRHLLTHTSGLPNMPHMLTLYRQLLTDWPTNPYATYTQQQLLRTFHRHRTRTTPGTRWRYSNVAAAVCGRALAHVTNSTYPQLLTDRVLRPLGLHHTRLESGPPGTDAPGHRKNGTPALPVNLGALSPSGCIRATPNDLLTYLEAHLAIHMGPLHAAVQAVRMPHTAPRPRRAPARSLTWFTDDTTHGTVYFHGGATFGHTTYLGYQPATHNALVALATRRNDRHNSLNNTAHNLLVELATRMGM